MTIRMDSLIKVIANALDIVEGELIGVSTNHSKRVAVLCAKMGKILGKNPNEITALTVCAMLHDNALTEYTLSEIIGNHHDPAMRKHCEFGQRNIDTLNLKTNVKDFILYHHERPNGKGPFGKIEGECPLEAELISIADSIDMSFHLQRLEQKGLSSIRQLIEQRTGEYYSKLAAQALLEVLNWDTILSIKDDAINETAQTSIEPWIVDVETDTIFGLACFMAKIIDCKSVFTQVHSTQIANRTWFMSGYYKKDPAERAKLYLAASLHDIGKLAIPTAILEKPGKLDHDEFEIIKTHISLTYEWLKDIEGFSDICNWASNHHEKLKGGGYPFGKKGEDLDFNSRLLACIDIYQAVSEKRPYHRARNHSDTMKILYEAADNGEIDSQIVKDLDIAFAPYDGKELPQPLPQNCPY